MKDKLRRAYWLLSDQFGFDPRRLLRSLRGSLRYLRDLRQFRSVYAGALELQPCLYDWYEEGGSARGEYFLQDLHVAQKIHRRNPTVHVDIGSRVDGFVAHVASFREVEVFDIRPTQVHVPGIRFRQADLMRASAELQGCCDSLSCLHALEHFGLGRYGDTLDPQGSETGLRHMAMLLQPGGHFYLSVPLGRPRVVFNAHRVFSPRALLALAAQSGLQLREFAAVHPGQGLSEYPDHERAIDQIEAVDYALGIFTFERVAPARGPGA